MNLLLPKSRLFNRSISALLVLFLILALQGCATFINGSNHKVTVTTRPKGANVFVDGKKVAETPAVVKLNRFGDHKIKVEKEGFKTIEVDFKRKKGIKAAQNIHLAYPGLILALIPNESPTDNSNVVLGAILTVLLPVAGYITDAATKATYEFDTNTIRTEMVKMPLKVEPGTTFPIEFTELNSTITDGKKIGELTIANKKREDVLWGKNFIVSADYLRPMVSTELADAGYLVPSLAHAQNRSFVQTLGAYRLKATVTEAKFNMKGIVDHASSIPLGNNLIELSFDFNTSSVMKVKWELFAPRGREPLFSETTTGRAEKTTKGAEAVLMEALQNSLSTFLSNEEVARHLSRSASKATEEAVAVKLPGIVNHQKEEKITSYMHKLVTGVVTIQTEKGHGSGFFISENGYLVTNYHVASDQDSLKVLFDDGRIKYAKIVEVNADYDLALLKVEGSGYYPLAIDNSGQIPLGIEVYAIGTPADIRLGQTITKGITSGKRIIDERLYIQMNVSVSPGNSGGPLITEKGEVLGVVNAKVIREGVEGIGFAIPASEIAKALNIEFVF